MVRVFDRGLISMAAITKSTNGVGIATPLPNYNSMIAGLAAGEALATGDVIYIKSDGTVWRADGSTGTAKNVVRAIAIRDVLTGQKVTLARSVRVTYCDASGLTPGAEIYLSASVLGGLDTATSTNCTSPVAFAISDTDMHFGGQM
jgi:hypothetical protein